MNTNLKWSKSTAFNINNLIPSVWKKLCNVNGSLEWYLFGGHLLLWSGGWRHLERLICLCWRVQTSGTLSSCDSRRAGLVSGDMEVVIAVNTWEEYVCAHETTGGSVCCAFVVEGKAVGARVATDRCSSALTGWVSEVAALAALSQSIVRPVEVLARLVVADG